MTKRPPHHRGGRLVCGGIVVIVRIIAVSAEETNAGDEEPMRAGSAARAVKAWEKMARQVAMRWLRWGSALLVLWLCAALWIGARAASGFADPAFQAQWQQG